MQVTTYIQHNKELLCSCEKGQRIASLDPLQGIDVSTIYLSGKGKFRYLSNFISIDKITLI